MADEICEAKMTEESVSEAKVSSYFDALQSIPFSYYTNDQSRWRLTVQWGKQMNPKRIFRKNLTLLWSDWRPNYGTTGPEISRKEKGKGCRKKKKKMRVSYEIFFLILYCEIQSLANLYRAYESANFRICCGLVIFWKLLYKYINSLQVVLSELCIVYSVLNVCPSGLIW